MARLLIVVEIECFSVRGDSGVRLAHFALQVTKIHPNAVVGGRILCALNKKLLRSFIPPSSLQEKGVTVAYEVIAFWIISAIYVGDDLLIGCNIVFRIVESFCNRSIHPQPRKSH